MALNPKFGDFIFITDDFMKFTFTGGDPPLEPPLKVAGG